jgi:hypothetical protein
LGFRFWFARRRAATGSARTLSKLFAVSGRRSSPPSFRALFGETVGGLPATGIHRCGKHFTATAFRRSKCNQEVIVGTATLL